MSERARELVEKLRQAAIGMFPFSERGDYGICDEAADFIEQSPSISDTAGMREALERIKRISQRKDMGAPAKVACIESIAHDALSTAPIPMSEDGH